MKVTWIVLADSARARIFTLSESGTKLRERADLSHPQSRIHDRDLTTDLPGRAFDSHGQGRHAMEQRHDPKEHEAQIFAANVARELERARSGGPFDSLVLVAPPKFLGLLRTQLDKGTHEHVIVEIHKNLVETDLKTLERRLPTLIREARG